MRVLMWALSVPVRRAAIPRAPTREISLHPRIRRTHQPATPTPAETPANAGLPLLLLMEQLSHLLPHEAADFEICSDTQRWGFASISALQPKPSQSLPRSEIFSTSEQSRPGVCFQEESPPVPTGP